MAEVTLLNAVEATGAGATRDLQRPYAPCVVQAIVGGTAAVTLQGSLNGTNWNDIASFAGSGVAEVTALRYVRGNVTAHTSGAVTLILGVD